MLEEAFETCALIAILRGLTPERCIEVCDALVETGFKIIEVPLNSTHALESIRLMHKRHGKKIIFGAGTVLNEKQVEDVASAGGKLIVSPNCDLAVIAHSRLHGLYSIPGCATPSEIFYALDAGVNAIKLFPCEMIPPAAVKAFRAVTPPIPMFAVGGIEENNMQAYLENGVTGFGLGSSLFKPTMSIETIKAKADTLVTHFKHLKNPNNAAHLDTAKVIQTA